MACGCAGCKGSSGFGGGHNFGGYGRGYKGFGVDLNLTALQQANAIRQKAPALYYAGAYNQGIPQTAQLYSATNEPVAAPPAEEGMSDTTKYMIYGGIGLVALVGIYFVVS